jgi:large subunit ribosomal protein L25
MADQILLSAETRPGDGKGEARALRNAGRVPAVTYGSNVESVAIHVDAKDLRHALSTDAGTNAIISLDIGGTSHLAMPREIHRHPVRRDVMHLDFVAIDAMIKVTVTVPLHVLGEGPEGAIVSQPLNVLTIEVLPLEVPDVIEVSIEGLEVGDVVRAGEIPLPDGVELLDDPQRTAVSITLPDTEPVEEEEGVETEVVGEEGDIEVGEGDAAAAADAAGDSE